MLSSTTYLAIETTHNLWYVRTLHFSTGQENVPWSFHLQVLLGLVANNVLASSREVVKQINDTKGMDDGQWERLYAVHNIETCDCPSERQQKMVTKLREQFGLNLPHGNTRVAYSEHFKERAATIIRKLSATSGAGASFFMLEFFTTLHEVCPLSFNFPRAPRDVNRRSNIFATML